jgi:hypothetical protein
VGLVTLGYPQSSRRPDLGIWRSVCSRHERARREPDRTATLDPRGAGGDPGRPRTGRARGLLGHHPLGRDRERV